MVFSLESILHPDTLTAAGFNTVNIWSFPAATVNTISGQRYVFCISSIDFNAHPFFISTAAKGGRDAVTGMANNMKSTGISYDFRDAMVYVTVTFNSTIPAIFYYASLKNNWMGGVIHVFPVTTTTTTTTVTTTSVACVVSTWSNFGQCSELCGSGKRQRFRNITISPVNAVCPNLFEFVNCSDSLPACTTTTTSTTIVPTVIYVILYNASLYKLKSATNNTVVRSSVERIDDYYPQGTVHVRLGLTYHFYIPQIPELLRALIRSTFPRVAITF